MLYGLYQALPAIRQQKRALLMEGYLDVIISHQYGLKNAVASLGTAFTPDHARLLRRYTREVSPSS
jgi:DNA primase